MSYKTIQLYCPEEKTKELFSIEELPEVLEFHAEPQQDGTTFFSFLVPANHVQHVTDRLQQSLGSNPAYRTIVMTVDAVIPQPEITQELEEAEAREKGEHKFLGVSREELLEIVSKGVELDSHFFYLVIFSTIVAAIGLLEDNVAVVIGAMVIAPLLGPNLALAFASSLGDRKMIRQAFTTNIAGFSTCLAISVLIGLIWPYSLDSRELMMRTDVNFEGVVLAIVSGAAAVLSLTRGISSVMVGVMVAVALLPPATTFGIMLGAQQFSLAAGALLLLMVNIVCVNLAAKTTLLWKGVRPRTWYQQKSAKGTQRWYLAFWIIALLILLAIIYLKREEFRFSALPW
ncbi:TIGR00341 family protein [Emcibacter sp.]|uniref:TIGR00341 family protein n=1 Tax=Emcibacter sp. TaxID=1979954 RepID=UPI003A93FE39